MSIGLHQQISDFQKWRDGLSQTISDYRSWLNATNTSDGMQDLRLFDMTEALRKDQLVLAFVAEFSRGKTETINALFFADFNQRLLPSEAGRTTMCPTEIFWSDIEEPCIKLLPIETRKRDDSLAYLKSNPNEWTKIRLDTNSADAMKEALYTIVQQKDVSLEEAKNLGLWNAEDIGMQRTLQTKGIVEVPVWRHALINYPHPLLQSGLVILDTPGLNTLGAEPELTLSIIPNAHAIIFLLATDTGVTKSDMQIWTDHLKPTGSRKLAVLNKIDILWDDMKTSDEVEAMIQSQVGATAHQLGLPPSSVLAISAQKALLAKIRKDRDLLEKSGISKVEQLLANHVVGAKHQILSSTIITEIVGMLKISRKIAQQKLEGTRAHLLELQGLRGKNQGVVQSLIDAAAIERKKYEASVTTLNMVNDRISVLGKDLLNKLSPAHLDDMLEQSRQSIGDSWTTMGLNRGMKDLIRQTTVLSEEIQQQSVEIKKVADEMYQLFHSKHGFEARTPPPLNIESFGRSMQELEKVTAEFCSSTLNMMTEKHFLVRKFFMSLGNQAKSIFQSTHQQCVLWLGSVLGPLQQQVAEYQNSLEKRMHSMKEINENLQALEVNMSKLKNEFVEQQNQCTKLDQMLLSLIKASKPSSAPPPPPK